MKTATCGRLLGILNYRVQCKMTMIYRCIYCVLILFTCRLEKETSSSCVFEVKSLDGNYSFRCESKHECAGTNIYCTYTHM